MAEHVVMEMEFRDIEGRYSEASSLIRTAFGTNKEVALDYNADVVKSAYEYPGTNPQLTPVAYDDDNTMISMIASFPRRVVVKGKELRLALLTWNSVAPTFRGRGLGADNVCHAALRARATGFDGVILYCTDGSIANKTTVAGISKAGFSCPQVFTVHYLVGLISRMAALDHPALDSPMDSSINTLVRLSASVRDTCGFARVFDAAEAAWECAYRYGAVTETLETGSSQGMLTGYILEDVTGTPFLFVECILWSELAVNDRSLLLERFLDGVGGRAKFAVVPLMRYADMEPFRAARFRLAMRRMNAYVSIWNGEQPLALDSMYIDVF